MYRKKFSFCLMMVCKEEISFLYGIGSLANKNNKMYSRLLFIFPPNISRNINDERCDSSFSDENIFIISLLLVSDELICIHFLANTFLVFHTLLKYFFTI